MKRLKEDLKNHTFHPVYLLYGEEDYLKRMYRDRIRQAVAGDGDDMNASFFEGKETDFADVRELADTMPFFRDYRIVVLQDTGWFKSANEVADYLPQMPSSTVLVFVEKEVDKRNRLYKYANKNGLAVEMASMSEKEMKAWIALLLKENGRQMRESTAGYFLEQVEPSMTNVRNELEKLISYSEGRTEITREDVDAVCCIQITGKIFPMMDAVAMGNRAEAMRLYRDLLALRESPMSILYLLTRHFHILLQIKSMPEHAGRADIAKKAGVPPFTVGKYQSQCRRFSRAGLREMLDACIETEYGFKRGNISDRLGVEILLLSFMKK